MTEEELLCFKLPPHSELSEQGLVGGIFMDPSILGDLEELTSEHFYTSKHRSIYSAIEDVVKMGQTPDILTVADQLKSLGILDDMRLDPPITFKYLANLASHVPSTVNALSCAKKIMERSLDRQLILASQTIADMAYGTDITTEEKLLSAQSLLLALNPVNTQEAEHIRPMLKNAVDQIDKRSRGGDKLIGLSTGYKSIDFRTQGFANSDLIIIAGRPGMGKTTFAMNIAQFTILHGGCVLVFSMEMPKHQLIDRMLSSACMIPYNTIRTGKLREEHWTKLHDGVSSLMNTHLYIDDRGGLSPNEMRATARKLHRKIPIKLVVVDYIQLARVKGAYGKEQEVSEVSRSLKELAKELDCPVIGIAQLNRDCEKRINKRPLPSDLRDSGGLEQDADIIQFLYRDVVYHENTKDPNTTEVITSKFRNGTIGTDYILAKLEYNKFVNMSGDYTPPELEEEDSFEYKK